MTDNEHETEGGRLHRSPQYPSMSLRKAVELVKVFWNMHRKDRVSGDKAIVDIGYKPTGSSGQRALSALVNYGLLESAGPKSKRVVWISDLGRRIVSTPDDESKELIHDLQTAAMQPDVMNKLLSKWADGLPLQDQPIKTILLRDLEFNPSAVDSMIDVLKDTYEYARFGQGDILTPETREPEAQPESAPQVRKPIWTTDQKWPPQGQVRTMETSGSVIGPVQQFNFPLISGGSILVQSPPNLTKRDIERFYKWWDLTSEALLQSEKPDGNQNEGEGEGQAPQVG